MPDSKNFKNRGMPSAGGDMGLSPIGQATGPLCSFFFHLGPSRRDAGAIWGAGRPPAGDRGACRPLGGRPAVPCLYKRCSPPPLSFELKNQRKIQKKERRRKRRSPAELRTCDLQVYSIAIVE